MLMRCSIAKGILFKMENAIDIFVVIFPGAGTSWLPGSGSVSGSGYFLMSVLINKNSSSTNCRIRH
jgi:hypothetical protein